jgi:hypothetical protein
MLEPLQCVLPEDNGQVGCHDVLHRLSNLGSSRVDGQPVCRVLFGCILVDIGDLKVRRPLDHSESRCKGRDSTRPPCPPGGDHVDSPVEVREHRVTLIDSRPDCWWRLLLTRFW